MMLAFAGMRRSSGSKTAFRNSSLLCGLLRPQGPQRELPSGAAGAGPGAAQRRESLGIGHLGPGDAALSHRGPVVRWTVIGRLQEYLGLGHPEAVGCSMAATSPSRAIRNRREWPGSTGAWARWPTAMFLARQPAGPGVGGQGLYLPKSWTPTRTGVLQNRRTGGTKRRSWPWRCWSGSWSWARAEWVASDGLRDAFREGRP